MNYSYTPYQPTSMYQNAFQNPYQTSTFTLPQKYELIKVSGENGASAFQMAPNSSVLLLDESQPIVWLKTTDGAGYPTLTPYTITPYKPEPVVDTNSLEQRVSRLEEVINESYSKSNEYAENVTTNPTGKENHATAQVSTRPAGNGKSNGSK